MTTSIRSRFDTWKTLSVCWVSAMLSAPIRGTVRLTVAFHQLFLSPCLRSHTCSICVTVQLFYYVRVKIVLSYLYTDYISNGDWETWKECNHISVLNTWWNVHIITSSCFIFIIYYCINIFRNFTLIMMSPFLLIL